MINKKSDLKLHLKTCSAAYSLFLVLLIPSHTGQRQQHCSLYDLVICSSCCLALRADKVSDRSLLSLSRRLLSLARASSTRSWCWAILSCCCSSNTCHHNRATGLTQ